MVQGIRLKVQGKKEDLTPLSLAPYASFIRLSG